MQEPNVSSATNPRAQPPPEPCSVAPPREQIQPTSSNLNQLQVPSSGGTNLGGGSNNHKGDSSYAVDAILEQISKQNIVHSKQDTATVLRSPLEDGQFERAESIENGIEKAAKRPSSKFNYEEFKNLAADRKPSAMDHSSGSSNFQAPPLVKIISENIEHIRPRKIDPRKSIEPAAPSHKPSGHMEESSIIVQINDKTGINFNPDGDPILTRPEAKLDPSGQKKPPGAAALLQPADQVALPVRQSTKAADPSNFGDTKFRSMQDTSVKNDASQLMPWPRVRTGTPTAEQTAAAEREESERLKRAEKGSKLVLSSESKRERFEVACESLRAKASTTRMTSTSKGSTKRLRRCC